MKKVRVVFCIEEEGDETNILAVFPQESFDKVGNITCYSTIGQHSGCSRSYFQSLKVCDNPKDYLELKQELIKFGYKLTIINEQQGSKGIKRFRQ